MSNWGYRPEDGPENWGRHFSSASGNHQSPIDIIIDNTRFDPELEQGRLAFTVNPVHSQCQTLHFTGHNFRIDTSTESMITTGVPGFESDEFRLVQFHFHWGNDENDDGSEHRINGRGWPSELHLVHYNSTRYADICQAVDKPDGLVVVGVFIDIGPENPDIQRLMEPLKTIHEIQTVDLHGEKSCLNIENLLPKNTDRYFTYPGSLTTPPCCESVTWIVFEEPLAMSETQLAHFRQVHNDDCGTTHNNRPVCLPNDRQVKRSFQTVN